MKGERVGEGEYKVRRRGRGRKGGRRRRGRRGEREHTVGESLQASKPAGYAPEVAEVKDRIVDDDITYDFFLSIPAVALRWHRQLRLIRFWLILKLCERLIKLLVIAGKQLKQNERPFSESPRNSHITRNLKKIFTKFLLCLTITRLGTKACLMKIIALTCYKCELIKI